MSMAVYGWLGEGGLTLSQTPRLCDTTRHGTHLQGRMHHKQHVDHIAEIDLPNQNQMGLPEGIYTMQVSLPPFEYLQKEGGHRFLLPSGLEFSQRLENETIQVLRHNQDLQERTLNNFGLPRRDYDPDVQARLHLLELKLLDQQKEKLEKRRDRLATDVAIRNVETSERQEQLLKAEIISLQAVVAQRDAIIESFKRERNNIRAEVEIPDATSSQAKMYRCQAERVYEEAFDKMKWNLENLRAHNAILWQTAQSLQRSNTEINCSERSDLELMAAARTKMLNEKIANIKDEGVTLHRKDMVSGSGQLGELEHLKQKLEAELRSLDHIKGLSVQRLNAPIDRTAISAANVRNYECSAAGQHQSADVRSRLIWENKMLMEKLVVLEEQERTRHTERHELLLLAKQESSLMFAKVARQVLSNLISEGRIN